MEILPGDKFILKFDQRQVHLGESLSLDKSIVDIGVKNRTLKEGTIWEILTINYIAKESRLFAEIIDYNVMSREFSVQQNQKLQAVLINRIHFKKTNTGEILNCTEPIKVIATPIRKNNNLLNEDIETNITHSLKSKAKQLEPFSISFFHPIKKIDFKNGSVEFQKFISKISQKIKFKITNQYIIEEYDSVKNYFASYLKSKKIEVEANISVDSEGEITCHAQSKEIDRIDDSCFDSIKIAFIKGSILNSLGDCDIETNLYTIDELYKEVSQGEIKSGTFYDNAMALVEDILKNCKSKHYNNLRYLSSKHLANILRLRFVLNPFSFVFLLENTISYFIVWETLNTKEATYIWVVKEKNKEELKIKLNEINAIIGTIKKGSKNKFLKSKPKDFHRIYHDYSNETDGFKNWINEINSVLKLNTSQNKA